MFKVGDTIIYSDGKVYLIKEETVKDYGRGPQQYFILEQHEKYKDERNTAVFAPFSKVQSESRKLMSKKEVIKLIDEMPNIEPLWINDCKQRKIVFTEYAFSKDPKLVCKLIKSFHNRDEELKDTNKSLTITDKKLMEKLKCDLFIEMSIALKIEYDEVIPFIEKRLKK